MIDLEKLEALAKAANSGLPSDSIRFALAAIDRETILALIAEVRALREFHAFFRDRCEGLFAQFGMDAVDLYNAAAVVARKEGTC